MNYVRYKSEIESFLFTIFRKKSRPPQHHYYSAQISSWMLLKHAKRCQTSLRRNLPRIAAESARKKSVNLLHRPENWKEMLPLPLPPSSLPSSATSGCSAPLLGGSRVKTARRRRSRRRRRRRRERLSRSRARNWITTPRRLVIQTVRSRSLKRPTTTSPFLSLSFSYPLSLSLGPA